MHWGKYLAGKENYVRSSHVISWGWRDSPVPWFWGWSRMHVMAAAHKVNSTKACFSGFFLLCLCVSYLPNCVRLLHALLQLSKMAWQYSVGISHNCSPDNVVPVDLSSSRAQRCSTSWPNPQLRIKLASFWVVSYLQQNKQKSVKYLCASNKFGKIEVLGSSWEKYLDSQALNPDSIPAPRGVLSYLRGVLIFTKLYLYAV